MLVLNHVKTMTAAGRAAFDLAQAPADFVACLGCTEKCNKNRYLCAPVQSGCDLDMGLGLNSGEVLTGRFILLERIAVC